MTQSQLQVFDDRLALHHAAAELVASLAREPRPDGRPFSMALCGGGTPQDLYRRLGQPPYSLTIPWPQVHIFWGDERCVRPDHPDSNYFQAYNLWLGQVPLPARNIHRIRGELTAAAAALDYTDELRAFARATRQPAELPWPVLDLVLLGLGEDGHLASLFPGQRHPDEASAPVLAVSAHYQDRPAERVTLTPLVFNLARTVIVLVAGAAKAPALAAALAAERDPARWPAHRLQLPDGLLLWMVDRAAAGQLKAP